MVFLSPSVFAPLCGRHYGRWPKGCLQATTLACSSPSPSQASLDPSSTSASLGWTLAAGPEAKDRRTDEMRKEMIHKNSKVESRSVLYTHTRTLTPLSRQQEACIDRGTCCRVLRWSSPANRNRLSIRRTSRLIYGCGSSLMCHTDTMGTSRVIQHTSVVNPSQQRLLYTL